MQMQPVMPMHIEGVTSHWLLMCAYNNNQMLNQILGGLILVPCQFGSATLILFFVNLSLNLSLIIHWEEIQSYINNQSH